MDKASEHYSEDCGLEPHNGASQPGAATGQGGVGWCGGREGVPPSSCLAHMAPASSSSHDSLAEWSKALASGASPQGRGLEPHSCHHAHHQHRSPSPPSLAHASSKPLGHAALAEDAEGRGCPFPSPAPAPFSHVPNRSVCALRPAGQGRQRRVRAL